ncbi:hypothetical protein AHIS1636_02070 [Arthrobacter mangrovi]|uniref:DUF4352 domain-containing protein n=1 Tax=Arthrobacter mangrovi TaxID=2966350 RepID=A0ABQ5MP74_9MICC|nr:hypothetical protein AHIS1636_02070 [Arthrobacter mangrovi]
MARFRATEAHHTLSEPQEKAGGSTARGGPVLSRRQLGLLFGGGAAVIIGGASFGVVAKSVQHARTEAATAFGSVRLLRAARLARLSADGSPSPLVGRVALARMSGQPVTAAGAGIGVAVPAAAAGHGGHGGAIPGLRWPQPENHTWGDVILVELEVTNTGTEHVPFSPGQLRLRPAAGGFSTSLQDADRDAGALVPGRPERLWVSFLAPETAGRFLVEFTDPLQDTTVDLHVPDLVTVLERS